MELIKKIIPSTGPNMFSGIFGWMMQRLRVGVMKLDHVGTYLLTTKKFFVRHRLILVFKNL